MQSFVKHAPRVLALLCLVSASFAANRTALDRYVATPDSHFQFELVNTIPGEGVTAYVLEMTSQSWRTPQEVDRPLWKHWLTIVKPAEVKSATGLLFIAGGSSTGKPPARADPILHAMAAGTNSVVAELRMVPNQPVTFSGETKPRYEDSLIAYTWDKFLRGGDDFWPARLPMTKAAVRAMDAVTAFCASEQAGRVGVRNFVVSGASKRGWTAWATGAVDGRVVALMPLVIDLLNVEPSFDHHYRAYGLWAPAVKDYVEMKIVDWTGTPQFRNLMRIEDPYEYRGRLTMPKYIVNASGDQFFLPDSSQFYWEDLKGEKHLRYVPNTDHSLAKSDARESIYAFYELVQRGMPRPRYSWKIEKNGSIRVKSATKPLAVKLWQASNPDARDFRLETIGPGWAGTDLKESAEGVYLAGVAKPQRGWTAFFIEMTYPTGGKHPLKVTSGVNVVPGTLPHAPPKPSSGN